MKDNPTDHDSPIKFPSDFTIKVIGKATREFENAVLKIMEQHVPHANYLAYTITIYVFNKSMLDAIYRSLSQSSEILFVL